MSTSRHPRSFRLVAAAAASILPLAALAACGDSEDATDSTSAASDNDPLVLGFLMSVKGEDVFSVDDYFEGVTLAVETINAAGGYNGQPIETFRVAGPADPTALTSALLEVAAKKPDLIIGSPSPTLAAIARQTDSVAIPIIGTSSYAITDGKAAGSKWVFQTLATDENTVDAAAKFAVQELGGEKVAVLHTNEAFGLSGSEALKKMIPAAGGTIVTDQGFAADATDLTGPVLAAKAADVVVSWAYPAPQAAAINALANQGSDLQTVGNAGISSSVTNEVLAPSALTKVFSTVPCNVHGDRPATKDFLAAYKEKYNKVPSYISAQTFDSVYLAVEAATKAEKLDSEALLSALQSLDYTGGACAGAYKADSENVLVHEVTVQGFTPDSVSVTKKIYSFE